MYWAWICLHTCLIVPWFISSYLWLISFYVRERQNRPVNIWFLLTPLSSGVSLTRAKLMAVHAILLDIRDYHLWCSISSSAPEKHLHKNFIGIYNIERYLKTQEGINIWDFLLNSQQHRSSVLWSAWSFTPSSTSGATPTLLSLFNSNQYNVSAC